jgi:hypothetical protein
MRALFVVAILALGVNVFANEPKKAAAPAAPAAAAAPAPVAQEVKPEAAPADDCSKLKGKAQKECMKKHEAHK